MVNYAQELHKKMISSNQILNMSKAAICSVFCFDENNDANYKLNCFPANLKILIISVLYDFVFNGKMNVALTRTSSEFVAIVAN